MDLLISLGAIISVLMGSLIIAVFCKSFFGLEYTKRDRKYLFGHNNTRLAVSSNIGTLFSLSLYFSGMFLLGQVRGKAAILPVLATYFLISMIFFLIARRNAMFMQPEEDTPDGVISSFVGKRLGINTQKIMVLIVFFYCFSIISCELFLFKEYLNTLVFSDRLSPLLIVVSFMCICYYYTRSGGFAGVLRTDSLQMAILVIWLVASVAVWLNSDLLDIGKGVFDFQRSPDVDSSFWNHFLIAFVGLVIYFGTLILGNMGLWTRTFGTLSGPREIRKTIFVTFPALALLTVAPIMLGAQFQDYALMNGLPDLKAAIMVIGNMAEYSDWYFFLTVAAMVAVALTTIDSLLLHALQNVDRLDACMKGGFYKGFFNSNTNAFLPLLALVCCLVALNLNFELSYLLIVLCFTMCIFATLIILAAIFKASLSSVELPLLDATIQGMHGARKFFFRWHDVISPVIIAVLIIQIVVTFIFSPGLIQALNQVLHVVPILYYLVFVTVNYSAIGIMEKFSGKRGET